MLFLQSVETWMTLITKITWDAAGDLCEFLSVKRWTALKEKQLCFLCKTSTVLTGGFSWRTCSEQISFQSNSWDYNHSLATRRPSLFLLFKTRVCVWGRGRMRKERREGKWGAHNWSLTNQWLTLTVAMAAECLISHLCLKAPNSFFPPPLLLSSWWH